MLSQVIQDDKLADGAHCIIVSLCINIILLKRASIFSIKREISHYVGNGVGEAGTGEYGEKGMKEVQGFLVGHLFLIP